MEEEKKEPSRSSWTHGSQVGLGPLRDAVRATRETVASSMEEVKAELARKKAILSRFKKG